VAIHDHEGPHVIEVWQDESPFRTLNLAIWFEKLFLFDVNLNPVTLDDLERARKAWTEVAKDIGWHCAYATPTLNVEDLLERITRC
jgi:hypothetical protein